MPFLYLYPCFHKVLPLAKLYQPVLNMIDQDLHIFNVIANTDDETVNQSFCQPKPVSPMAVRRKVRPWQLSRTTG